MQAAGERVAVATVVSTKRSAPRPLGSRLAVSETGAMVGSVSGGCVESDVALRAAEVLGGAPPMLVTYGITDDDAFDVGLPCGGEIEVFIAELDPEEIDRVAAADAAGDRLAVTTVIAGAAAGEKTYGPGQSHSSATREGESTFVEHYAPPPLLLIFGAVDTAQHLSRIAKQVGFRTVVSDARAKFATPERLPDADEIVVGWPAQAYDRYPPDEATYVVTLTHDARFDEPALGPALRSPVPYIGALGSRRAQETRRRRLLERRVHRSRDRPDLRAAGPRHRGHDPGRDRRLDHGRGAGGAVGTTRGPPRRLQGPNPLRAGRELAAPE